MPNDDVPRRQILPHQVPSWVRRGTVFYITICCTPRRSNHLCHPEISRGIFETIAFRNLNQIWFAHIVLLMPDHLHGMFSFFESPPIRKAITDFKAFVARRHRVSWQRDFFDHRLRDGDNYEEKAHYIRMNPVRAGLVRDWRDWPYVWPR